LKALGYHRVITVMNTSYGEPTRENLPFDLAHLRWPLPYSLSPDADAATKAEEKRRFTQTLKDAVKASLAWVPHPVIHSAPEYTGTPSKDGPARFRSPDQALGYKDDPVTGSNSEVFLESGPAMWLRVMPGVDPQKRWPTKDLLTCARKDSTLFPLLDRNGGYSYVRASDGQGIYYILPPTDERNSRVTTDTVAFAFRTGEIWSVDVAFLTVDKDTLYYSDIEQMFVSATERYRSFLRCLDISGPYRWKAGLVGVKGRRLVFPLPPGHIWAGYAGPICAADLVEAAGILNNDQKALEALLPFFEQIFDECGIVRPDHLARR
jgi:hypothetical protein